MALSSAVSDTRAFSWLLGVVRTAFSCCSRVFRAKASGGNYLGREIRGSARRSVRPGGDGTRGPRSPRGVDQSTTRRVVAQPNVLRVASVQVGIGAGEVSAVGPLAPSYAVAGVVDF